MKRKEVFITGILTAVLLAGCGSSSNDAISSTASTAAGSGSPASSEEDTGDEIENYTRYADYTPAEAEDAGITSGSAGNILVAYFSRSTNTSLTGVDAVSSASLDIQDDDTALGNAQQMAEWISDETGGDLYPIQTMYTYPVDYDQTVDVGEGQDSDGVHPVLINPIDLSSYDLIYLVYPIWHYTLPAPIVSFLEDYDLSGKTVCCFTTSGGSGFADTIRRIQEAEPDADVIESITVPESSTSGSEEKVRSAAADLKTEYAPEQEKNMTEKQTIQIQINDQTYSAELEDNETAAAFREKLPLTLQMQELNGNEKYAYDVSLPSDAESVGNIQAGDLMLYGDDCLVLFYDSFSTSYSYTRIGHITDPDGLADAVGNGSVQITFSTE
ncbi:MAG: cyclophilin-like fold protein [Bilifractor sp.]|jgi:flavodoxin